MYDSNDDGFVRNDYLHFCYAKSTRTLEAVALLIKNGFREDPFVLLRAIYENYLHFWYVLRNPDSLDSFVMAKIGRSTRELNHPKNGPERHLKVIDKTTGEKFDYGRSMSELARNGSPRISSVLHELLYEYLCEFSHNHFMAFGGYLKPTNKAKITARRYGKDLEVVTYALLLSTMWLESFSLIEETETSDPERIRHQIKTGRKLLLEVEKTLKSEGKYKTLQSEIRCVTEKLGEKASLKPFVITGR